MCRGYHRRQTEGWRRTRLLATVLVNLHRDAKTPALSPEELLPLPGDTLPEAAPDLTPEDVEALWALLDERDAAILT
ncbi:hypothetical protein [Hymenobacter ginkgonis]|nr:hypothetical protein [Hymenobacter ginkgonis]